MTAHRISSWCLLGGIAVGFLGAIWHGHRARFYSKPADFQRFHLAITPDTLYYPPYAMLENLALARWRPGQTLVIIGGNSVLNGASQPRNEIWSLRLQELLGDSYVVVNLAFNGCYPAQGAALVAESLVRRGIPVILVANTSTVSGANRAPGAIYGYLYWQARAQGQLVEDPLRDRMINDWLQSLPPAELSRQKEERLAGQLDAALRFQSLWHHVGYRHVFTVWSSLRRENFWLPRERLPDRQAPSLPLEARFQEFFDEHMAAVRNFSAGLARQDETGQWILTEAARQKQVNDIEAAFVPLLRPHTLVLLSQNAPYYLERLSPEERRRDDAIADACAQLWRDRGVACAVAGRGFESADYSDWRHLSVEGGRKLAAVVAEKIRQLPPP